MDPIWNRAGRGSSAAPRPVEGAPGEESEDWSKPSLQETRAIIFAARQELAELTELLDILDGEG